MNTSKIYNQYAIFYNFPSRFDISNSLVVNGSFVKTNEKFGNKCYNINGTFAPGSLHNGRRLATPPERG